MQRWILLKLIEQDLNIIYIPIWTEVSWQEVWVPVNFARRKNHIQVDNSTNDSPYSLVMSAIDHRKHRRNFKKREGLLAAMLSGVLASAGLVKTRSHACIPLNCNTVVIAPPLDTNTATSLRECCSGSQFWNFRRWPLLALQQCCLCHKCLHCSTWNHLLSVQTVSK